jgi:hypothetical protein
MDGMCGTMAAINTSGTAVISKLLLVRFLRRVFGQDWAWRGASVRLFGRFIPSSIRLFAGPTDWVTPSSQS